MHFNKTIKVGNITISENSRTFIIAEAGINHNGDMKIAKKLIDCAIDAGADAVKFQAFKTKQLVLKNIDKAPHQLKNGNPAESQYDMLKEFEITKEQNVRLNNYAKRKGIIFLSTPYDEYSLEELNELDLSIYKISSTDITNLLFLKKIAQKGKPVILSTGMAYFSEVISALKEIYPFNKQVILLQCTANYPIEDKEANLNVLNTYQQKFDLIIGYSDHSLGIGAAPYAVAMGAKLIEKHFTLDRNLRGPDHKTSLNPGELKQLVGEIRKVEQYLGSGAKAPVFSELETRKWLQKCLVAAKGIRKGEVFCERNITAKRTGGEGISPLHYKDIIGQKALKSYKADEIIGI